MFPTQQNKLTPPFNLEVVIDHSANLVAHHLLHDGINKQQIQRTRNCFLLHLCRPGQHLNTAMTEQDQLRAARLLARNALERAGKLAFKPVSSAKWLDVRRTWAGKLHVCIEHDTIRGCTPRMMRWWFENLARRTTWDGEGFDGPEVSFYRLWHHRDHVAITPMGHDAPGFAQGKWTRVSERFNDFHERIEAEATTDRLDHEEFTFTCYSQRLARLSGLSSFPARARMPAGPLLTAFGLTRHS